MAKPSRRWLPTLLCGGLFLLGALPLAACGPKSIDARMANGEKRATDAERSLDEAEEAMKALEPDSAAAELKEARDLLTHADVEYYPDRSLIRERMDGLEARLPAVRQERAKRDLQEKVAKQRARLEEARAAYEKAYDVVQKKRDLEEDDTEEVSDALEELRDSLDDGAGLELEDKEYQSVAKDTRQLVETTAPKVKLALWVVAFREGPAKKGQSAKERLARAKGAEKDEQLEMWQEARAELYECRDQGEKLLGGSSELGSRPVTVGEKNTTPKAFVASCVSELKSVEKRIKGELDRRARAEAAAKAKERAAEKAAEKKARAAATKKKPTPPPSTKKAVAKKK